MPPLALLMLLAFLAVLVMALMVWTLLSPPSRRPTAVERSRAAQPYQTAPYQVVEPTAKPPVRSNDELRGAKARVTVQERPRTEDAFERFLRAGREDRN